MRVFTRDIDDPLVEILILILSIIVLVGFNIAFDLVMDDVVADNTNTPINETFNVTSRKFEHAYSFDENEYVTEMESKYVYSNLTLCSDKTALILIDVWNRNTTYNKGFYDRSNQTTANISHVLTFSRLHNISVVRSYSFYEPYFAISKNDYVIDSRNNIPDAEEFDQYLKTHNIDTILYVGYSTNMCILFNPTGMIEMNKRGYHTFIIRDCTLALETPDTYENEYMLYSALTIIETQFDGSITSLDLMDGQ